MKVNFAKLKKIELPFKIFDGYITKQVFGATLVCIFLFVVIWIAPETLLKVIKSKLYCFEIFNK